MYDRLFTIPTWRIAGYILTLSIVFVVLYVFAGDIEGVAAEMQQAIEDFIVHAGVYSYIVYVALVALFTLTPVASSSLWLVAGYLFNPLLAIGLTVLAELIGAVGNYYIGKYAIGGFLSRGKLPRVSAFIERYRGRMNAYLVFTLGVIPVSTTNVTAYAAALTGMSFVRYLVPWTLGVMVPATLSIMLGRSASAHSPWLTVGVVVSAGIIMYLAHRFVGGRKAVS